MVDHTFLYTGAVKKIKALVDDGTLGTLQYLDSTRINLGLFQHDVNVLWDLAPHDLSILLHIYNEKPHSVKATGAAHTTSGLENIAYLTVSYKSGFIAHFSCSWVSPVKIRQMLVGGSNKMIVYNDMEPSEKIKIYDTGYQVRNDEDKHRLLIDYRTGDIYVPKLENTEALSAMARDFAASIADKKTPVSTAELGLEVVRLLEASDASLRAGGAEVLV
jgi:predicted dehydrogenase